MRWSLRCVDSLDHVSPAAWDALQPGGAWQGYPFTRHAYLRALETGGCVAPGSGWTPSHCLLEDEAGRLRAAAPCYLKAHSFGEFVFDFAWANAYHQVGLAYYPKLLCAVPFAPVVGPRLLAADAPAAAALAQAMTQLPEQAGCSSLHALFGTDEDADYFADHGALLRRDCQYHWHNRGYRDFDDFLDALPGRRRKEIRRERRKVADAGIDVRVLAPSQIDTPLLEQLLVFYGRTYWVRGQQPYLSAAFFHQLLATMPEQTLFFVAFRGDKPLAMAFMMRDARRLYGRHWGCLEDHDSLHFQTCYYAGIEYCIAHGLHGFDAGAQGEHKLRRGFEPVTTWSAHWLREPRLRAAVGDFLTREAEQVAAYHRDARAACAFPDAPARPA